MKSKTWLKRLAIAEGISYLCFGITVPVKYLLHIPEPNFFVGMIHGILFIAYCLWVLIYGVPSRQSAAFFVIAWLMALVPLGTFWFDKKYLNHSK